MFTAFHHSSHFKVDNILRIFLRSYLLKVYYLFLLKLSIRKFVPNLCFSNQKNRHATTCQASNSSHSLHPHGYKNHPHPQCQSTSTAKKRRCHPFSIYLFFCHTVIKPSSFLTNPLQQMAYIEYLSKQE